MANYLIFAGIAGLLLSYILWPYILREEVIDNSASNDYKSESNESLLNIHSSLKHYADSLDKTLADLENKCCLHQTFQLDFKDCKVESPLSLYNLCVNLSVEKSGSSPFLCTWILKCVEVPFLPPSNLESFLKKTEKEASKHCALSRKIDLDQIILANKKLASVENILKERNISF